MAYYPVKID